MIVKTKLARERAGVKNRKNRHQAGKRRGAMFDTHGRIKCGTISVPDFQGSLADWTNLLGYECVETGKVPIELANGWDAIKTLGARTALLAPPGGGDTGFVRLIEQPAVLAYLPMRTYGWVGYELTVRDVPSLHDRLRGSSIRILTPPERTPDGTGWTPIEATGRAGEVLFFNAVTDTLRDLEFPRAVADVDRIMVAMLAAADRAAAVRFHVDALGFSEGGTFRLPYPIINNAFGLPPETESEATVISVGRMPVCEIDQFPAGTTERKQLLGYLPPGNAVVSFAVRSLAAIRAPLIAPPETMGGPLYAGRRAACTRGAAGELIELIEVGGF
jgi:catechol 2,3-dioxygenase-like lactoylglutathione lyase family enzyme